MFIRSSALGDIILASHIGKCLKSLYPNFELTWMTEAQYAPLGVCMPWFSHILQWNRTSENKGFFDLIKRVRAGKFDILFNIQDNDRMAFLSACSGISRRIGYHRHFQFIYTDDVYQVMGKLGIPLFANETIRSALVCPEGEAPHRVAFLKKECTGLVVLAIGASYSRKRWPAAHWRRLVEVFRQRDYCLVLTGSGTEEEALAHEITGGVVSRCVLDLVGKLTLIELLKLLNAADCVIAGDTGPLHLARALGKKVIGLFGPTSLAVSYMKNLDKTLFTSCEKMGCRDYGCRKPCMELIMPEKVVSAFDEIMKAH